MDAVKNDLSPPQRLLLENMQRVNYGRILHLEVRGGEPVVTPRTRIERLVRFGGENQSRPEIDLHDFALKGKVIELFEALERMGDGLILKLEIKGGLPFDMIVEERAS